MQKLGEAGIACNALGGEAFLCTVCCMPCMYGNALDKAINKRDGEKKGVFDPTSGCVGVTCLSLCVGGLAPCCVGIWLRTSDIAGGSQDGLPACLAESCIICSCAPCQIHHYLTTTGDDGKAGAALSY